jgi:uncharacterized phiE125 gp8 family phage protein
MAMIATAIFSLADLKTFCRITDGSQDATLEAIANGVTGYCEARTSRIFKQRTVAESRNGDGTALLLRLPRPIVSVTSLTIDGAAVSSTEYVVFADRGKLQLKTRTFPPGVGNVQIVIEAGYADPKTEIPQVFAAALDLAKSHYDEWQNGAISLSSISIGPASTVVRPGLNPRVEKYLDSIADVRG